jgi:hypothetical protein
MTAGESPFPRAGNGVPAAVSALLWYPLKGKAAAGIIDLFGNPAGCLLKE